MTLSSPSLHAPSQTANFSAFRCVSCILRCNNPTETTLRRSHMRGEGMSFPKYKLWTTVAVSCLAIALASAALAQTTTTGDISGVISDPSGAVVPNVALSLKNLGTGAVSSTTSNAQGAYHFALLQPGTYSVTANATGFQAVTKTFNVSLGADTPGNLQLALSSSQTTIEVTGTTAAVETEDANVNTNFNNAQVALLPNPGNDLAAVALTAPGVVMNTAGGSAFGGGDFEVFGLPATSNLFTIDGANNNDPYFNVNNTDPLSQNAVFGYDS